MAAMNAAMLDAPATEIAAAVRSGALRSEDHVTALLARIRERNPRFNAYIETTEQRALDEARRVDRMVAQGRDPGALAGVPFAVKNLFDVSGMATLAGSKINRDRPAAKADACLVARLVDAGAVLVGTLNMDEWPRSRWAPTPTAPYAYRRRIAGCSVSSRRSGACPVPAAIRSSQASITWGRSGAVRPILRRSTMPCRVMIRTIPHVGPGPSNR
jgi:hypothetical protein